MIRAVILSNYIARMKQLWLTSSTGLYKILLALEKYPCVSYNIVIEREIQSSKLCCGADSVPNCIIVACSMRSYVRWPRCCHSPSKNITFLIFSERHQQRLKQLCSLLSKVVLAFPSFSLIIGQHLSITQSPWHPVMALHVPPWRHLRPQAQLFLEQAANKAVPLPHGGTSHTIYSHSLVTWPT